MKRLGLTILVLPLVVIFNTCNIMNKKADLIIHNTQIYIVDPDFSIAQAMAVKDGKVVATGTNEEVFGNYTADNTYNASGKAVYPGFIDGHCHFYGYGAGLLQNADLVGTKSFEEIIDVVRKHHDETGMEWILGRGWDQNDWPVKKYPTKEKLDELFPDNPVVLTRIDGHALLANSEALKRAGITSKTKIDGGEVILNTDGEPTGVLIDNAMDPLKELIPQLSGEENAKALDVAQQNCFAVGLTSVVDAGLEKDLISLIDSLQQKGILKMKINAMLSPNNENLTHFIEKGPYVTDKLSVRSVKLYADGALGSRGALLLDEYTDDPGNYGLLIKDPDYYRKWAQRAYDNNFQVCTHTIGDSGARVILDIYGEFLKGKNDRRWRIEHAQIIHPDDMHKFGKYAVIPSVQGNHATSDMYWAEERLGPERIKWSYAFKELLKENSWLINGTDFPIENISPLHTFYATVARKDLEGYPAGGFLKKNSLSRKDALKSMTLWAAKGSFEENTKGSLEPGKQADFVILEKDIMNIPEDDIPNVKILQTYIDGEKVYQTDLAKN